MAAQKNFSTGSGHSSEDESFQALLPRLSQRLKTVQGLDKPVSVEAKPLSANPAPSRESTMASISDIGSSSIAFNPFDESNCRNLTSPSSKEKASPDGGSRKPILKKECFQFPGNKYGKSPSPLSNSRSPSELSNTSQPTKAMNGDHNRAPPHQGVLLNPDETTVDPRGSTKGAAKDIAALREELEKEKQKSIQRYGQVIMKKDQEITTSNDSLHKARQAPTAYAPPLVEAQESQTYADEPLFNANHTLQATHDPEARSRGERKPRRSKLINVWGTTTDSSDDAETMSADSITPMHHGKFPDRRRSGVGIALPGWDSNPVPPPVDWQTEAIFNNSSSAFFQGFQKWLENVCSQTMPLDAPSSRRRVLDLTVVPWEDLHADGLALVPKQMLKIPRGEEQRYGYTTKDAEEFQNRSHDMDEHDWEDWGKLDPKDEQNAEHGEETAEMLCRNMNAHWAKERAEKLRRAQQNKIQADSIRFAADVQENKMVPKANIYIRPAIRADIPQVLFIFNSYVENSARTSELEKIQLSEMQGRLDDSANERLPFLVAILKDFKSTKHTAAHTTNIERVVGYGLATDFCLSDRAEKYTAELELYVHQEWLHKKIGSCLLDKLLEVCDGGYIRRQGYFFHSDEPSKYYPGGSRDLMSLVFVFRFFYQREESEFERVKNWLAEFDFEEKGLFDHVGMKKGRITNLAYLVRRTAYEPGSG